MMSLLPEKTRWSTKTKHMSRSLCGPGPTLSQGTVQLYADIRLLQIDLLEANPQ
jgi:hypothetical protein